MKKPPNSLPYPVGTLDNSLNKKATQKTKGNCDRGGIIKGTKKNRETRLDLPGAEDRLAREDADDIEKMVARTTTQCLLLPYSIIGGNVTRLWR
ncbi:hypothetical protein CEXT_803471 [Caerostris extrusa]|uniref:Uncharacterized protein n=1 Tax=Caerostris extrusa TaxID=172846 RepID=A0AAV4XVN4_CAEEX|nr:hypothetical protein CEXT_803471 [Caerostris extrusa]